MSWRIYLNMKGRNHMEVWSLLESQILHHTIWGFDFPNTILISQGFNKSYPVIPTTSYPKCRHTTQGYLTISRKLVKYISTIYDLCKIEKVRWNRENYSRKMMASPLAYKIITKSNVSKTRWKSQFLLSFIRKIQIFW